MNGNLKNLQSLTGKIKSFRIDTTLTKKGMCAEAEATGKALATKVSITDIVDDLLSVASDKPLSANQGRLLKKQIDEIDPHYAENVVYDNTNVKSAIDGIVNKSVKVFIGKSTSLEVDLNEGCCIVWSQNTNCGGLVVVDAMLGYINKIVTTNDSAGNFKLALSNKTLTLTNNLGGSVQCYIQKY